MGRLRNYFTFFVIIYMTGINFSPNAIRTLDSIDIIDGNITTRIIKSTMYVIAFFILISKWKYAIRISAKNVFIWVTLLWVFTSVTWSAEPAITLRRSVGLLGTTVIALYFASYYDYKRFAFIAAWSFLIIDILSLLVITFYPARGISLYPYGWQGIYFTKNGLGINALFGIILFTAVITEKKTTTLGIIGLILSIILLIGSKSTTSLIVMVFALSIWGVLLPFLNKNIPAFIFLLACFLIMFLFGIWLYLSNYTEIAFRILGKDPTLTGRVPIWEIALLYVRQRPWIGYGYGAVWLGKDYGIGADISNPMSYYVVNAHNGYLDLLLELGVIGVALILVAITTILYKLLANINDSTSTNSSKLWPVVFLIALIVYNSTEAMLLVQNSIAWIMVAFIGWHPNKQDVSYVSGTNV